MSYIFFKDSTNSKLLHSFYCVKYYHGSAMVDAEQP